MEGSTTGTLGPGKLGIHSIIPRSSMAPQQANLGVQILHPLNENMRSCFGEEHKITDRIKMSILVPVAKIKIDKREIGDGDPSVSPWVYNLQSTSPWSTSITAAVHAYVGTKYR